MSTTLAPLRKWVDEVVALTQPDHVVWCDGSDAENARLVELMLGTGDLLDALLHRLPAAEAELPSTGVSLELEKILSSPFVHAPAMRYGTRSSMIVHWHADGRLDAREWTHQPALLHGAADRAPCWPLAGSSCTLLASDLQLAGAQPAQRL